MEGYVVQGSAFRLHDPIGLDDGAVDDGERTYQRYRNEVGAPRTDRERTQST